MFRAFSGVFWVFLGVFRVFLGCSGFFGGVPGFSIVPECSVMFRCSGVPGSTTCPCFAPMKTSKKPFEKPFDEAAKQKCLLFNSVHDFI